MSRFNSGGKSIIKLDASGNIDTSKLESELRSALEFDVRYRQQDNMKKKAVKVSGSYDEFKAMVACAHLKTLSSKEVQSLAAPKKGWQKSHVAADSTSATVTLQQEQRAAEAASVAGDSGGIAMSAGLSSSSSSDPTAAAATAASKVITVAPNLTFLRPKSALALERDLQKLSVPGQRTCYLAQLGHKRVHKLLKGDAGCDVLELILAAVLYGSSGAANKVDEAASGSPKEGNNCDSPQSSAPVQEAEVGAGAETELSSLQRFEWLAAAIRSPRFSVSVHFVPAPLLEAVRAWLGSVGSSLAGEGVGPEAVADVLSGFSKR